MTDDDRRRREFALKEKLLKHVTRYRLTVPAVTAKLFLPAHLVPRRSDAHERAEKLLNNYVKGGLLTAHEAPGKSRPRYYLPAGASPGEAAVNADVSILWFCLGGPTLRHRLTRDDLKSLVADPPYRNIAHCVHGVRGPEGVSPTGVIYRMAPTTAETKEIVRMTRRHLKDARKRLPRLVDDGDYGFAILVDTDAKAKAVREALSQPHPDGDPPLNEQARMDVCVAPRADSLAKFLAKQSEGEP